MTSEEFKTQKANKKFQRLQEEALVLKTKKENMEYITPKKEGLAQYFVNGGEWSKMVELEKTEPFNVEIPEEGIVLQ